MNGVIKKLAADKGFGFIRDEAGKEYFFHRSGVENNKFETLHEGQAVLFDEEMSPKGPRATRVRP